ncbi:hypothetical protein [Halapricum salinum]|uniref:Uncharacterized protein n=1 Tax=Halapricum salinum TaxID=1457250 RepID=A0A4D6HC04_9EURY|nr:hypothetical protein [Halapricum salinum]QCC50247.1 hypothetical protein DV733_02915 [Halapricum salinum]
METNEAIHRKLNGIGLLLVALYILIAVPVAGSVVLGGGDLLVLLMIIMLIASGVLFLGGISYFLG